MVSRCTLPEPSIVVSRRSAAKLSYKQAQSVLDGQAAGFEVQPEHNVVDFANDIKIVHDLAKQLRERRYQTGCIRTESLKLTFQLDENGMPADCVQYEHSEANHLVEEVCRIHAIAMHGD